MNDYVMAIACTKDTEHADRACFLNPGNGTDGFLCLFKSSAATLSSYIKKYRGIVSVYSWTGHSVL